MKNYILNPSNFKVDVYDDAHDGAKIVVIKLANGESMEFERDEYGADMYPLIDAMHFLGAKVEYIDVTPPGFY